MPNPKHKSENRVQTEFMNWCRWMAKFHDPRFAIAFHIPNGGLRSKREAHTFKLMGVLPGVPDVFIPIGTTDKHGLYIEFKDEKGRLSDAQKELHPKLIRAGYAVEVCRSAEEGIKAVEYYLDETLPRKGNDNK